MRFQVCFIPDVQAIEVAKPIERRMSWVVTVSDQVKVVLPALETDTYEQVSVGAFVA